MPIRETYGVMADLLHIDASEVGEKRFGRNGAVYMIVLNEQATSRAAGVAVAFAYNNASASVYGGAIVNVTASNSDPRNFAGIVVGTGLEASGYGLIQIQGVHSAALVKKDASSAAAGTRYILGTDGYLIRDTRTSTELGHTGHGYAVILASVAASSAAADTAGSAPVKVITVGV